MFADQKLECSEVIEEYAGRVLVLGMRGLGTTGPFLTQIETPGGQARVYHHPRGEFSISRVIGIETINLSNKSTFFRTFEFQTGEPLLDPAYMVSESNSPMPLGELFGYRPDLTLAEKLGVSSLKGQHEGMVSSGVVSRIRRELGLQFYSLNT